MRTMAAPPRLRLPPKPSRPPQRAMNLPDRPDSRLATLDTIALWIANGPCVQALPAHEVEFLRNSVRNNSSLELFKSFT
jgi:hypothetical protein